MTKGSRIVRIPGNTGRAPATLLLLSDPIIVNMQKVGIYSYGHSSKNATRFSSFNE
jgi:hypothetical protein